MTAISNTVSNSVLPTPGRVLDFARIKSNAVEKGYEGFVVDAMIERSVSMALTVRPHLLEMKPGDVKAEVGKQFLANMDRVGGFRFAYTEQLKVLRKAGQAVPEQRLEQLAISASEFIEVADKRALAPKAKEKLIEDARTTASALRAFGLEDQVVGRRLAAHPILKKHNIDQIVVQRIDEDRESGVEARARARSGVAARTERSASAPRMR